MFAGQRKGVGSKSRFAQDYTIQKKLGAGTFGAVFSCRNQLDQKQYAVKLTALKDPSALREVANLAKLPTHANIVQYYTCWKDRMDNAEIRRLMGSDFSNFGIPKEIESVEILCIPMELCSGDLRFWLGEQRSIGSNQRTKIAQEIVAGLQHIHSHSLIHRDLKPENIFLSRDKSSVKIGDLGISAEHEGTFKQLNHTKRVGTPLYLAPEQETSNYGKEVDIFALGIIFFELLHFRETVVNPVIPCPIS